MTLFLPLDVEANIPSSPSFLVHSSSRAAQLSSAVKAILKARRIVVISGAGISVQAGIPDFRSPEGLFQSLKRDNPREALVSGKDLFDASVFKAEGTTSLFCQMISELSHLSRAAQPTPFHNLLRSLDDAGKLLRVYTQNIDAIEAKAGLTFGVPEFEDRRGKSSSKSSKDMDSSNSRLPTPPSPETPRCIPLHGTLQMVHCQICNNSFPLEDYYSSFSAGLPPHCPECTAVERIREQEGKRTRGVGKLRPSVVLYNETHKDGEGVGEVVRKDLVGSSKGKGRSGADLLLVVGTSLRVPGTKRMVREFAKATRSRSQTSGGLDEDRTHRAIYINLDFPVPTREWDGVFDTWIQGDAQEFADIIQEELDKDIRSKNMARERKRKREEDVAHTNHTNVPTTPKKSNARRKATPAKSSKSRITPKTPSRSVCVSIPPYKKSSSQIRRVALLPPTPEASPTRTNARVSPQTPPKRKFGLPPGLVFSFSDTDSPSPSPSPDPPPPVRNIIRIPPRVALPVTPPKVNVRSFFSLTPLTPESTPPRRAPLDLPRSPSKSPSTRHTSPLINVVDMDSDVESR